MNNPEWASYQTPAPHCDNGCCIFIDAQWCGANCTEDCREHETRNFCPGTGQALPPSGDLKDETGSLEVLLTEHRRWAEHNFGAAPTWQALAGVQEEVGELAHAFLKRAQGVRVGGKWIGYRETQIADAVGDTFLYLAEFCRLEGISMIQCIRLAWKEIKQRRWGENAEGDWQEVGERDS